MTFCEMHKKSGCSECPNRFTCKKPENAFDIKAFEVMGYEVGQAFAAYMRGFTVGIADGCAAPLENVTDISTTPDGDEHATGRDKTLIEDCRGCWCNTCAAIEECENGREGFQLDGVRPRPCLGCYDGMRFMKKYSARCQCDAYIAGAENNG